MSCKCKYTSIRGGGRETTRHESVCDQVSTQADGLLTTGTTITDAFLMMYVFETACQIQIMAQSSGGELIRVPQAIIEGIQVQAEQVTTGLGGALIWPGLLRKLDRTDSSFRD